MKKRFFLVVASFLMLGICAGCAAEPAKTAAPEADVTPSAETAAEQTTESTPRPAPAASEVPEAEEEQVPEVSDEPAPLDLTASSYSIRLISNDTAEARLEIYSGRVQEIFLYGNTLGGEAEFNIDAVTDETVCTVVPHGPNLTISGAKAGSCDVTASSADANGNQFTAIIHVSVNDNGQISFEDLTNTGVGPGGGAPGGPPPGGAPGGAPGAPPPGGAPSGGGEAMKPGGIMFCGSSLMGGFDVGTYLSEDGYEVSIGNVTMGGTIISDFAEAQQENIVSMQPGAIFINIGSVDVDRVASGTYDMQFMYESYKDLLTYLKDKLPDCNIYVMAYYPSQENTFRPNALVDQCNIWVESLASELELNFVNVSDVLKNEKGYLRDDFSSDGIHLTDEAYRLVYAELKDTILDSIGLK